MRFSSFTILRLFTLVVLSAALGGCIKQPYEVEFTDNTKRLITEFTEGKSGFANLGIDFATGSVAVDLTELRAVTRSNVGRPYTVRVVIDNALVTAYNVANGTRFTPVPSSALQLASTTYNLSADQRSAMVKAQVTPTALTGAEYAVGLRISEVGDGEISGDAKSIVIGLTVKNIYDGTYRVTGTQTHYGGPTTAAAVTIVHNIDKTMRFETLDAQSFLMETGQFSVTGAYHGVQVNPATNACTIFPLGSLSFPITENAGTCTYNPSTRTFTLNYRYFNSAGNVRVITQTAVRQ